MKLITGARIKIAAILVLSATIVLGLVFLYYYHQFSRLIETKLASPLAQGDAPSEIYAAPLVLYTGRQITPTALADHLRRLGFKEAGSQKTSAAAPAFQAIKNNGLEIYNPGWPGLAERVHVKFSGGTIQEIKRRDRKEAVPEISLPPELITTLFDKSREKRKYIRFKDLPRPLVDAVLAAEDKRFFGHPGFDVLRSLKAMVVDLKSGELAQGGSTLTQQFVKNFFLTREKKFSRKISEIFIAILIEHRYRKEQIFELYANSVYMGQRGSFSIVGLGEAADAYFHKNVSDLSLAESALLAGIIQIPNRHTPYKYPGRAKARRDLVLDTMAEAGFISPAQKQSAKQAPLGIKPPAILNYSDAPYFVDYIREQFLQDFTEEELIKRSYRIYTTLNMDLQKAAYEAVTSGLKTLDEMFSKRKRHPLPSGTVQAALIALDPRTGNILAMVGGRNYAESQFNRVTEAKRQPGSIFKPFVYAAALDTAYTHPEAPLTAISMVMDEPSTFEFETKEYHPRNYKNEYHGMVTLREALTRSLNVSTVKIAEKVGYDRVVDIARKAGLNEEIKAYPSVALGTFEVTPLEMARAYTIFATNGTLVEPVTLRKITTPQGLIINTYDTIRRKALAAETAYMVTNLMQSVINHGTGAGVRARGFTLPAAGKTGTSHDGWFAGFTPELVCVVWVGFDDNRELTLSGSQSALPIWAEFMKKAAEKYPLRGANFVVPEGIMAVEVDPVTGLLAAPTCRERQTEYFIKGTEPKALCQGYEQFFNDLSPQAVSDREAATSENGKGEGKGFVKKVISIFKN
ncbi:MAG: PBP1A family penicillin-binding protein [Acidobacteria bacterium]|nr:PBP1A family penicillin-binding protein [Acidobacteriota bacterium]MBI3655248.1 PBP1A family penicillin-binding protein [Acidobacteriota bacterium]